MAIGPLIANLLHCLREILQDLWTQIEVCNDDEARVRTRRILAQLDTSSGGRRRYIISAEQIEVLRNIGMQWKAIANCLGVSPKKFYRRRIEYGIADSYTVITKKELESNIRDILRLTPYSGETYIRGALRSGNIYIPRWRVN